MLNFCVIILNREIVQPKRSKNTSGKVHSDSARYFLFYGCIFLCSKFTARKREGRWLIMCRTAGAGLVDTEIDYQDTETSFVVHEPVAPLYPLILI